MKILYDHQIFSIQKYGGISRYFAEIIDNLPDDVQSDLGVKFSTNAYLQNLQPSFSKAKNGIENLLMKTDFKGKVRLVYYLNRKYSIEQLKQQNFDVFHPTYYDDYFLDYIGNRPFVLTIHDMIHELYPEMNPNTDLIFKKANLASKAAHIIAVSEQTKKDIIEILNIREGKISVIYHASSIIKNNQSKNIDTPEEYVLYVGDRSNYKNFQFLLYSMASFLRERKKLKVICTGRSFNAKEKKILQALKLEDTFIHLYIRESNFFSIYNNAQAFIFPSYYEGFGIPILEAFDSECPMILSNSSCFPEVAGDAAIYFEPKSKKQLISALELVLDNKEFRNGLVKKGTNRLESFSWLKSATQTYEVYKKVLS